MVRTKLLHEGSEKADGERILIDEHWPQKVSRASLPISDWVPELAPSPCFQDFQGGALTWEEFRDWYSAELNAREAALEEVVQKAADHTVTLLSARGKHPYCPTYVLKEVIEDKLGDKA